MAERAALEGVLAVHDRQLSRVPRYRFVDAWAKVQRLADGPLPVGGTDDMRATAMLPAQR
ncbi:hypothetical protein [Paraburkholderia caballeronis]|uniref:hypothetical protein n=1 Tax=Paraburkholderia caballeronis TaxID=416943 RepID=UPI00115FAED2|nr:hypothetical protein [Paraburkholderia caballeronis]